MSSKEALLEHLIEDFDRGTLLQFYKLASDKFRPVSEDYSQYLPESDKRFENIEQIGRIEHEKKAQTIAFFISSVSGEISERGSKKKQYDIGKKILKDNYLDAGIFVFYGQNNFRLSLIAASYSGPQRKFTTFKRYTYFVSPELTNKTFKDQLKKCDFSSIDNILEAFSIEAVNKDFYTQIAKKFTDLVGGWLKVGSTKYEGGEGCLVWPDNSDEKRKEFAVRLIGRLVFCWFLKKKHSEPANVPLVPKDILSLEAAVKNDSYYLFVLEPLFFQVLNKKLNDRHKKYKTNGWDKIPFLNGGLFTPHSDDYYNPDDFQGISPRGGVKVPDEWLRELLGIFERYNFTIDENTPVDIEISIDPEMLGRIFENLLAMINPETGETARKSTGSYYTPRPIVEYMVDQSIKQYLLTQTNIPEENIDLLLSYSDEAVNTNLTDKQNDSIIDALDKLKVLDPACGSGAFPIGILQKILLILQKVDPESTKWKTRLLEKIPNTAARKALTEKLESETWQYIHKLGVIQSSIYGVDIQPIAAEISKLRIFLSLIVDETVNDDKDNRGIEPLPNLKFKFVCGNSLIDKFFGRTIEIDTVQTKSKTIVERLTSLKADFFSAIDEKEKVELNLKILQGKIELAEQLLADLIDTNQFTDNLFGSEAHTKNQKKEKEKSIVKKLRAELLSKAIENAKIDTDNLMVKSKIELVEVDQIETRHFKESFIWKLDFAEIFAENSGFDIVIGNPPYLGHKEIGAKNQKVFKKVFGFTDDMYHYFYIKAFKLSAPRGIVSYITSNTFFTLQSKIKLRELLQSNRIVELVKVGYVFDEAYVDTAVAVVQVLDHSDVNYDFIFKDARKTFLIPEKYTINIKYFRKALNRIFFVPNELNLVIYRKFNARLKTLYCEHWDSILNVKAFQNDCDELTGYRTALREKEITLLGLITEGGQGLVTGNNSKYIACICRTPDEEKKIFSEFLTKLSAHKTDLPKKKSFANRHDFYVIAEKIKAKKQKPSIFGKFFLYKTANKNSVKDFSHLSKDQKLNGTSHSEWIKYFRGNQGGFKWSVPVVECIDWSQGNVKELKEGKLTNSRWQGSDFFDTSGFGWIDYFTNEIKAFFIVPGPYSKNVVKLHSQSELSDKYLLAILNSKFISYYVKNFVTNTHTLQINDGKLIPIIFLSRESQGPFVSAVNKILSITEDNDYPENLHKQDKVKELEDQIDQMVYELYSLTDEEIEIIKNSVKV